MNWSVLAISVRSLTASVLLGLLLGSTALLSGCPSFTTSDTPVPDSTFSQILVELHILSARHRRGMEPPPGMRDSVLTHHGVDSTDFHQTLQYYKRHPAELETLYNGVIDTLRAIEQDVQKQDR